MSLRIALLFCLLAIASARRPYFGFPLSGRSVGRIVGGSEAHRGEFPHQISLQDGNPPFLRHLCGGSILNNNWILTAGHCRLGIPGTLYVKAGKHLINSTEKSEQFRKVVKSFVHEKYPGNVAPYDIALMKLDKPLVYDESVQPIALPERDSDVHGNVVLSGWGSVYSSGLGTPDILQKAELPVIDLKTCKESLESIISGTAPVAPTNICTGPLTGGISACNGDSGGPLIKVHEDGAKEVVGVVSWGVKPCGSWGAASVYTRVSSYIDWIENIMANN